MYALIFTAAITYAAIVWLVLYARDQRIKLSAARHRIKGLRRTADEVNENWIAAQTRLSDGWTMDMEAATRRHEQANKALKVRLDEAYFKGYEALKRQAGGRIQAIADLCRLCDGWTFTYPYGSKMRGLSELLERLEIDGQIHGRLNPKPRGRWD